MALNINPSVEDVFYRYKMPRLQAKVEGKGNGIKTVIANMPEIAKALNRPPNYPTKYFGCELGAQTQFDAKNERYIVNGEHDQAKLQEILYGFIRKFVLCTACDNPETTLILRKNQIVQSCKACGNVGTIDNKHKLTTFIIKNPPPLEDKADSAAGQKKPKGHHSPSEETATNGDFAQKENGSPAGSDGGEDEDWQPETNIQQNITAGMANLIMNADLEKTVEQRLDMFYTWLMDAKKKSDGNLDAKVVVAEATRLDIKEKAGLLLFRVLFNKDVIEQIKQYKPILIRFTANNQKAQRYVLGGVEQLIAGEHKSALLPKTSIILKQLYDDDIVEEEVILDWAKKPSKKFVSKKENQEILDKAAPFVNWLQEAEEEEESDVDDNDDVSFGNTAATATAARKDLLNNNAKSEVVTNGKTPKESPAEDEINIDDI